MSDIITTLQKLHKGIEPEILCRLSEFRENKTIEKIKKEFFFCLLTPQCKARVCWENVDRLSSNGILYRGLEKDIARNFYGIRFRNNKARYIVEAREKYFNGNSFFLNLLFEEKDSYVLRKYIVKNV